MRVMLDDLSRQQIESHLADPGSPSLFQTFVRERQEVKGRRERVSSVRHCSPLCADVPVLQDYIRLRNWINRKLIADEEKAYAEYERCCEERRAVLEKKLGREGWDDNE